MFQFEKGGQQKNNLRSGDNDLSVNELLVEGGVLTILVGGGDEGVTPVLEPLADTKLVLGGTEQTGLVFGVDATLFGIIVSNWVWREG